MNFKFVCLFFWPFFWLGSTEGSIVRQHQASANALTALHKRSTDPRRQEEKFSLIDLITQFKEVQSIMESGSGNGEAEEGSGDHGSIDEFFDLEGSGLGGIQGLLGLVAEGSGDPLAIEGLLNSALGGDEYHSPVEGLTDLAEALRKLSLILQSDDDGAKDEEPDGKAPCSSPYIQIAYRMCIFLEVDQRLSWNDANEYCKSRGMELAMDSVVIKSRRYLNNELGAGGSRVRWPMWVGSKRQESERGELLWQWNDGTNVPTFLWADGQPRTYDRVTAPDGVCMFLDGFQEYYGSSLPCHFKRRFVCELPS